MKSIQLESGFVYQSFWGGDYCDSSKYPNLRKFDIGPYNRIRHYHDLTLHTVDGLQWIEEYQIDKAFPQESCAHHDWFSCDGWFHITVYLDTHGYKTYRLFKASTWRDNMESTFGNYLPRYDYAFNSFEEAAKVAAAHKQ